METQKDTTMTFKTSLPSWVYEWYKTNNLFKDEVENYESKKNVLHTKEENEIAKTLLNFPKSLPFEKKRNAPQAQKKCTICHTQTIVNSARRSCVDEKCSGVLVLVFKTAKEIKRKAPRCDKKCKNDMCKKEFNKIPTATSKCDECGEKLYIIK